ncbi:MAG: mechanosensitive ion channel family protein [Vicinamibacterales bacterium]
MWTQVEAIMSQSASRIVNGVAGFLPGLLALVLLLAGALVMAVLARVIIVRLLRSLDFDRRAQHWGLGMLTAASPARSASALVARATYWMILVFGLLLALTALDAAMPAQFALSIFEYAPNVLAALIILIVGSVLAQFLSRAVLIGAVNMHIQNARLLSLGLKWLVLVIAAAMALEQLRIGRQILLLAFGILFGGVVLATALAVGLGAKEPVGRAIERQLRAPRDDENRLDHV